LPCLALPCLALPCLPFLFSASALWDVHVGESKAVLPRQKESLDWKIFKLYERLSFTADVSGL